MSTIALTRPRTINDVLPDSWVSNAVLILGFALLTAGAAQIRFHLPWTPVPITGQTFAVLLSGAALGAAGGASSQVLYLLMGLVGLPFFSNHTHGWAVVHGATGGYLFGFIVAAAVVGYAAERRQTQSLVSSVGTMFIGSAIIYFFGVTWLAHSVGVSASKAIELGMTPFIIGDVVKLSLAAGLVPAALSMVNRTKDS